MLEHVFGAIHFNGWGLPLSFTMMKCEVIAAPKDKRQVFVNNVLLMCLKQAGRFHVKYSQNAQELFSCWTVVDHLQQPKVKPMSCSK